MSSYHSSEQRKIIDKILPYLLVQQLHTSLQSRPPEILPLQQPAAEPAVYVEQDENVHHPDDEGDAEELP